MTIAKIHKTFRSIVLLGEFQPCTFHPFWMVENAIAPKKAVEKLEVHAVMNDVTDLKSKEFQILIFQDRFMVKTHLESYFETIKDIACNSLRILDSYKIKKFGITTTKLFEIENEETWHRIGDTLAPKSIWNDFFPEAGLREIHISSTRGNTSTKDELTTAIIKGIEPINNKRALEVSVNHFRNVNDDNCAADLIESAWSNGETFEQTFFADFWTKFREIK